jgi:hypothetical protein
MKIQDLLKDIYSIDFNWMEELEVKHYIPIMDKKKFVMDILAECTDEVDRFIAVDRFKMNIYFNMKVLGLYTNLEIAADFDEMVLQYDALCENRTLDFILTLFANDYDVMYKVLDDMLDELLIQNSIDMQVVKVANKVINLLDVISENSSNFDFNSILPNGMDITKLMEILNSLK